MPRLRSCLFWFHLALGLGCGLILALVAGTGVLLAFEPQLLDWSSRAERRFEALAPLPEALSIDAAVARAAEAAATPQGVQPGQATVHQTRQEPEVLQVQFGRSGGLWLVHRPSGTVRAVPPGMQQFMDGVERWHRYLGMSGSAKEGGKAVKNAANLAMLGLLISGTYLWFPRRWSLRSLRPSLWFIRAHGRARDWNWHNVLGFWALPGLLVIVISGVVMSYGWAHAGLYRLAGEPPPPPRRNAPLQVAAEEPVPRSLPSYAALFDALELRFPDWTERTLRALPPTSPSTPPEGNLVTALPAIVRRTGAEPHFAPVQVSLHPHTGAIVVQRAYADLSPAAKIRLWLRYLHTGEALGWPGQLAAAGCSLAALGLIATGFSLSIRRWAQRRMQRIKPTPSG